MKNLSDDLDERKDFASCFYIQFLTTIIVNFFSENPKAVFDLRQLIV